ncbi:MAG TPA: tetratricopeptide repeat protein, partial [Anaerolineae bacterium]|nr:tetratricopeptide repeat protein [Anaerolineae bacterium]
SAERLLSSSQALIHELQIEPLHEALDVFRPHHLPPTLMLDIYLLHSDVSTQLGNPRAARRLCRAALPLASDPTQKGRVLRRLGKLYEAHDRTNALNYYQQAATHLPPTHPELIDLYTDRAWLFILGKEWDSAENDLQHALNFPTLTTTQKANLYDAYSILHSRQTNYAQALDYANQALSLREASGDLLRIGRSKHNLGIIYNALGQYERAIHIFEQAIAPYRRLGNQVEMATSLLSLGVSHHYLGDLTQAVTCYSDCLTLAEQVQLALIQVKAHANLAEALAELGHKQAAHHHWQQGFFLARQHQFSDQITYLKQLKIASPPVESPATTAAPMTEKSTILTPLHPLDHTALQLAHKTGQVTARSLMEAGNISKATATRRLAGLVKAGHLQKMGQRRGTYYVLTQSPAEGKISPDTTQITRQLQHMLPYLSQQFNVQQIDLAQQQQPHIDLNITFATPPTLATFLQTRTYLQQQLKTAITLHPT